jgi:flagellar motor switch protein FliN/FliY
MTTADEIAHLADIPIEVEVELDRKVMRVEDLLELEAGAVVKMSRSAGENIDILAGGTVLGYGEIVIIEDSVGVRITDFQVED